MTTIDKLLSLGQWTGVGNSWYCDIDGCDEHAQEVLYFGEDTKYILCTKHAKEYLHEYNIVKTRRFYDSKNTSQEKYNGNS